jgi:hypothetical protein
MHEKRNLYSSYESVKIVVIILLFVVSVPHKVLPCQQQGKSEILPVISVNCMGMEGKFDNELKCLIL